MHFFQCSTTDLMREIGVEPVANLSIPERLKGQNHLLTRFLELLHAAPRPLITDRTPLDFIGYTLGEVTMHGVAPEHDALIQDYVDRCLEATRTHFDMIVMLRPLPSYEVDPTKPPPSRAYQTLVQSIIEGSAMMIKPYVGLCVADTTDLDERVALVAEELRERMTELEALKVSSLMH